MGDEVIKVDEELLAVILLFILMGLPFLMWMWDHNADVTASNTANMLCKSQGFETYVTYKHKVFSSEPYNIVCGTLRERLIAEGKIVAYNTNNNTPIIVSGSGVGAR